MAGYYINVNLKADDPAPVRRAVADLFAAQGFQPLGEQPASVVTADEDALPEGDAWYGVLVSGLAGAGWVTVYVDDWQDSGLIARHLSRTFNAPALEVWVAEDIHWGYTYFEAGEVKDRFADAPAEVAETPDEAALYVGRPDALAPILQIPPSQFAFILDDARTNAGQFAAGPIDAVADAVGLPFEHVFTVYDYFFEDDPDDYAPDLEDWSAFRHLAFQPPPGRETLSE